MVGTGIPLSHVEQIACSLNVSDNNASDTPSKYIGGEIRKERNSDLATVGLAVEGTSLKNLKESIAFAVLQKVAGDGPRVKYGASSSPLAKALSSACPDHFGVVGFNASHSDSGLFGLILSAPAQSAGTVSL